MKVDIVMPKMGESLQEGTVIQWLKKEGEAVQRDEMILEISTDKVDTEVPSPVEGILSEILAAEGETIEVGVAIARIMTSGEEPAVQQVESAEPADAAVRESCPTPAKTVAIGAGRPLSSSAMTYEIPRKSGDRFYSPLVRKIAEENKVPLHELNSIGGSGIEGRVVKKDILAYIEQREAVSEASAEIAPMPAAVASSAGDEIIPMDRMRRLIADHMVLSVHTSPHVTSVAEADVAGIVKFRNKFREKFFQREGFKLTFTPFFAKACLDGIAQFPMINVSVDGNNIIRHRHVNLSFATALPDGNLIVPVIKNADALSITGLARSVHDLSTRARNKQLLPDDIQGGTFTITNVGTFGTLFGTPIINQPQVGIMGIGAIKKRPVAKEVDGEHLVVVRDMAFVTITYDHRVVDGMLAGQALAAIVHSLENMNQSTLGW